jgi:hypothetical protein
MSRYLSRLVTRAAGAVVPASIAPGPRRDMSASTSDDPFEATAPLALTPPAPPPTPGPIAPAPSAAPSTASEIAAPISSPPPPVQSIIPVPGGEMPPVIPLTVTPPQHPLPLQRAIEPENVAAATVLARPLAIVPKRIMEHIEKRDDAPVTLAPPPPPVVSHLTESPARVELPQAQHAVARVEPEPITPLPPVMVRDLQPMLAPLRPEPVVIPPPAPEPPRLVIGRLRVDVMPIPAPATPQDVRVIESRQSAAGRSMAPSSPLRFGLGQM